VITIDIKAAAKKAIDALFFMGGDGPDNPNGKGPSWKFRRKLIFGAYRLSVAMIVFGGATFLWDTNVSSQLVIGGVALLTIIVTAYTATATWADKVDKDLEP
jgi:hypothetical protein